MDGPPVTEEAVVLYRELAAAMPDRYRPNLASSLNNLAQAPQCPQPTTSERSPG